MKSIAEYS